jgi:hypothetical protein
MRQNVAPLWYYNREGMTNQVYGRDAAKEETEGSLIVIDAAKEETEGSLIVIHVWFMRKCLLCI